MSDIHVASRFSKKYDVNIDDSMKILEDAKKFLLLSAENPGMIFITPELFIIDQMWHTFLLFTHDYHEFCIGNVGRYLHHQPSVSNKTIETPEDEDKYLNNLKEMYAIIYDTYGEETLVRWVKDYPSKYSKETMTSTIPYL